MGGGAGAGLSYVRQPSGCRTPPQDCGSYYLSCDYGTVNPFSCGLWGEREGTGTACGSIIMIPAERDGKKRTRNTIPSWKHWSADCPYMPSSWTLPQQVLSPASAAIKPIVRFRRKMRCWDGIRRVSDALKEGKLRISPACRDTIREFRPLSLGHPRRQRRAAQRA